MTDSSRSQKVRRGSWRPRSTDAAARLRRRAALGGVFLLLFALLGWFAYALRAPFHHPRPQLAVLDPPIYAESDVPLVPFAREQHEALRELSPALHPGSSAPGPLFVDALATGQSLENLGARLAQDREADVLLVYLAAHGSVRDGQPVLLIGDYQSTEPASGFVSLQQVFAELDESPAAVKVLILESGPLRGRLPEAPAYSEFPELLGAAVAARAAQAEGHGRLWVLQSHSQYERSHFARSLQRSVFGYFVEQGLRGAADANSDRNIDLAELSRFVATQVSSWVEAASQGEESQTPWLAPELPRDRAAPVIFSANAFPAAERSLDIHASVRQAQEASRTFAYYVGARDVLNTSGLSSSIAAYVPAPLARFGVQSSVMSSVDAAIKGEQPGASDSDAAATSAESGEPGDSAASESGDSPEVAADPLPDLLRRAWTLRDQLLAEQIRLGAAVVSPARLRRFESRLLQIEAVYRMGRYEPRLLARELRQVLEPVELIVGPSDPSALTPRQQRAVNEWLGERLPVGMAGSLGWAKTLAAWRGGPSPDRPRELSAALSGFAGEAGRQEEFEEWLAALTPDDLQYTEVHLASRLAGRKDVAWPLKQLALQCAVLAEEVAGRQPRFLHCLFAELRQADRLRERGERAVLEPLSQADQSGAESLLRAAIDRYQRVDEEASAAAEAWVLTAALSRRAPMYLAWRRAAGQHSGFPPSFTELQRLFAAWKQLNELLDDCQATADREGQLRRQTRHCRQLQAAVERNLSEESLQAFMDSGASPYAIEDLLSVPLADADARETLLWAADAADISFALGYSAPAAIADVARPSAAARQLAWAEEQLQLEWELAEICLAPCFPARQRLESARELVVLGNERRNAAGGGTEALDTAVEVRRLTALAAALRDAYSDLPEAVASAVRLASEPTSFSAVREQWTTLRRAERAFWLVAPANAAEVEAVQQALRRRELEIALIWQDERGRTREAFAEAEARARLQQLRQGYLEWFAQLRPAADFGDATRSLPLIQAETPDRLRLVENEEQDFTVRLVNRGPRAARIWLLLHYDANLLQVTGLGEQPGLLYEPLPEAAGWRGGPDDVAEPLELAAGSTRVVRLQARRLRPVAGPSRIAVKIIADGGRTNETLPGVRGNDQVDSLQWTLAGDVRCLRQIVEVATPAPSPLRLRVDGVANSWSVTPDGVLLHPFANRVTEFRLALANEGDALKRMALRLVAPRQAAAGELPYGELDPADADRELARLGPLTTLREVSGFVLEPGQEKALSFEPPGKEEGETEPPPPAQPDEKTPPPPIDAGMILIATDLDSGQRTLRRIQAAPQRPRRFLSAEASYSLDERRITVRVAALDPSLLPPEGVLARCDFSEKPPAAIQGRLDARLTSQRPSAEMHATLPESLTRSLTLQVHVDEYPRAFLFRINPNVHQQSIGEWTDAMRVRIADPPANAAFGAPAASIPLRLEVDAPVNSFEAPGAFIEYGIDEDQDREFRDDVAERLYLDRQVKLFLSGVQGGAYAVRADVGDHELELAGRGIQNQTVNLLARLFARGNSAWSPHVPIVLDGAPPKINKVVFRPGRTVTAGDPLEVVVWCEDRSLGGGGKIEAAFDVNFTGEFADEPPPEVAKPLGDGRWSVELPTKVAGKQYVLLRAADDLGNVGETRSFEIDVISKEEAVRRLTQPNQIGGQVLFYDSGVAEAKVTLLAEDGSEAATTVADRNGQFQLENVKPGKYALQATGVVFNTPRFTEEDLPIEVPPGPTRIAPQKIPVR